MLREAGEEEEAPLPFDLNCGLGGGKCVYLWVRREQPLRSIALGFGAPRLSRPTPRLPHEAGSSPLLLPEMPLMPVDSRWEGMATGAEMDLRVLPDGEDYRAKNDGSDATKKGSGGGKKGGKGNGGGKGSSGSRDTQGNGNSQGSLDHLKQEDLQAVVIDLTGSGGFTGTGATEAGDPRLMAKPPRVCDLYGIEDGANPMTGVGALTPAARAKPAIYIASFDQLHGVWGNDAAALRAWNFGGDVLRLSLGVYV